MSRLKKLDQHVFAYCTSLENIYYRGSVASWDYLRKESSWKYDVPAKQVICIDGIVAL